VALTNLGIALKNAGRLEEAEAAQRRALDLTQTIYGPRHRKVALRHEALGRLLTRADRATEAVSHHLVAVEIHDAELGTEHPDTILSRLNLAEAQYAAGQTREGLDTYANAHQHAQKLAEDHPMRADAAIYYASKLVDAQRSAEAAPLLEPALAVLEPLESYDDVVALGRFTLARILWARDRSRALRLAHAAHGHLHPPEQAVLQQWLSTHDTAR
jgi:tetratricopeptide (TPR) repeat protein